MGFYNLKNFKFRVYNRKDRCYVEDPEYFLYNFRQIEEDLGSLGRYIEDVYGDSICKNFEIELCTSFKDVNGNDIFENDFLKNGDTGELKFISYIDNKFIIYHNYDKEILFNTEIQDLSELNEDYFIKNNLQILCP